MLTIQPKLQAPFPWFGGKSKVADIVWQRFGNVQNYVEPFFGSGAVLLGRPDETKTETVNDKDGFIANAWRSIQHKSDEVARWADNPVNENDLHARHLYLVSIRDDFVSKIEGDPTFYDPMIAGWWIWGICCWIGRGWCKGQGPWQVVDGQRVHLGNAGQGVHRPRVHLGNAGQGVNRARVHLGNAGQGVNRKRVQLGDAGQGIEQWMYALCERLRYVRVCCGDWNRVCGPSVTFKHGLTGVFFDPPYGGDIQRDENLYREESLTVASDVRQWCIDNGDNPLLRIALCGYDVEHLGLEARGWSVARWKTEGGYSSQSPNGSKNASRERIWFSPHCLKPNNEQISLF